MAVTSIAEYGFQCLVGELQQHMIPSINFLVELWPKKRLRAAEKQLNSRRDTNSDVSDGQLPGLCGYSRRPDGRKQNSRLVVLEVILELVMFVSLVERAKVGIILLDLIIRTVEVVAFNFVELDDQGNYRMTNR